MLEKEIEKGTVEYAKNKGFRSYKFVSPGCRYVPDRIFIDPGGYVGFIEFKADGGRLSKGQAREINSLIARGCRVAIVSDLEEGRTIIDAWEYEYHNKMNFLKGDWYIVKPCSYKVTEVYTNPEYVAGVFPTKEMAVTYCEQFYSGTGEVIPLPKPSD